MIKVRDVTVKNISMKYFCIAREKVAYLRWYRTSLNKRLTIMTSFAFQTYFWYLVEKKPDESGKRFRYFYSYPF